MSSPPFYRASPMARPERLSLDRSAQRRGGYACAFEFCYPCFAQSPARPACPGARCYSQLTPGRENHPCRTFERARDERRRGLRAKQIGQSVIEFVVGVFILLLLILGAFQFALIYRAKTTLDYAAFQAAREGAVNHASISAIRGGLAAGLTPLYTVKPDLADLSKALARATVAAKLTHIQIINPTKSAFDDFAVRDTYNPSQREIPNDNLAYRPTEVGEHSGMTVQDANILKIKVTYGYKLIVPFIKPIILSAFKLFGKGPPVGKDSFQTLMLNTGRLPLESQAIVRMQTPAFENGAMIAGGPKQR